MLFNSMLFTVALMTAAIAQEIDNDDVPMQCRAVCASIVSVAQQCDNQHRNDDRAELNCICSASGINTQLPLCEACVAQFDRDDDNQRDNDVNELLRSCSLSTTSFNPSAPTASVTNISGSPPLGTPTGSPDQSTGTVRPVQTSSAPRPSTASAGGSSAPAAEQTGNNAVAKPTAGAMGVGLGVLGLAMGFL